MNKQISIVLPVYNEEAGIAAFHKVLVSETEKLGNYDFEIIYVVDKSKDRTFEILRDIANMSDNVKVLYLSRRFGHQMSLVAGLDACSGEACIIMDCDLEHPPSFIPKLLAQYEAGFDVVHTRRVYSKKVGFFKSLTSKLFYKVLNKLSSEDLGEDSADFRLVSRKVIDVFNSKIREHNQYLRGLFRWVGFRQTEITFQAGERLMGKSQYTLSSMLKLAADGIVSFSKIPLKISVFLGLFIAFLGIVYGIVNLVLYFVIDNLPQGWATMVTLTLFLGGLILFVLGVIGEYIAAIFDEVKNRPLYIVEEWVGFSKNKPKRDI